jgi:tetratricopeptide (TPR) repeat protein
VEIWREVLPLDIQDKGWSTQIRRETARAEAALAVQTNARLQVAERCETAAAAMAAHRYDDAVAAYEAAQAHDEHVNDVLVEAEVLAGLDTAVTALENRNAARATARQRLDAAWGFARAQSWEGAIEACRAGLEGEAVAGWSEGTMEAALSQQLREVLRSCVTALKAREEARASVAELKRKGEALSADGDFTASAAAYRAGLQLDTQDAELSADLQTAVHLVQASDQLEHGRACMPSQVWEQAIAHFQRGLEHEPELAGHSVLRELRSGMSSCEASKAARDVSTTYAQQLLSRSLRQAFGHQNRHAAEQLCCDGHGHMQRRQYTASPQAIQRCL